MLPQRIQRWLRGLAAGLLLALQLLPAGADALPQAQRGVLELPSVPAQGVRLEGEWTLVRDVFLDPAADALPGTFVAVPGPWNAAGGALGWGTYALQVRCPVGQKLALSVPVQRSAMRLYVNGTLVVQQGEPGPSAEAARAAMGARATVTESFACPLAVRAHLSNFNHRQGGMVRAIAAGERMQLGLDIRRQLTYNTLMLGGYAMLGLLSLFFFAARRKDATPLYFGLFCLVQATSSDMVGERNLVLSFGREVPWELALRIEYLAWYATMASFLMVVHRLFLGDVRWRVVRVFLALIGLAMLAVAVLPGRISSHLIVPGQVLTVAMGVYLTRAVAAAARRRDPDAIVMLAGLVFLLVVVVVDALLYSTGYWLRSLTPLGLVGFALAPGFVMTRRVARALNAEELRSLEQRVRGDLLVRTTQAGIFDWDTTQDRRGYSQRLREMLGDPPQLQGGDGPMFHAFVHPDDREQVVRQFEQGQAGHGVASGELRHPPSEYRLVRADGAVVWVLAEAISLTGTDGGTLRFICSFLDISRHRAMEEGLKASHDQVAEQAGKLRKQNAQLERDALLREDVERMSRHDLKTPLNSLIGVVRLLREEARQPPRSHELLRIAERAGYRMLEMVNLSLDLFRMEQGSYSFEPRAVDLAAVVARVLVDTRSLAEGSQVQIVLDNGAGPWPVRGEELLCYSIVANLVKNAVEATPPGGRVDIAFLPGTPVRLRIRNPGSLTPGVARGFFDKYFSSGKSGGSGLGTYSARLMARVQEGELTLETGPGQGVAVVLSLRPAGPELPAAVAVAGVPDSARESAPAVAPLVGLVLVVDDDDQNRLVIRHSLPGAPLEVETAVHGRAALEAVARRWPDVVLIDMEMPVMDGLEATRRIRQHQQAHRLPACTIVMMSSNDDEASVQRGLQAGADHYLVKPLARSVLLGMLASLLPAAPPSAAPAQDESVGAAPAMVQVDAALLAEIPAFLASRQELTLALGRALDAQDRATLGALAHQCGGALAMWGFDWAALQCKRIEHGAGHADLASLRRVLAALERHLAQVRVEAADGD
ncbi:response regulator [uncultured Ramlibacter sp.]|uniref:response regulator n=1 Tax=uncultured Ramlibacter sp. TaxID=260755 RepID=UPI0026133727|nr:response regulator [uncultured Ramlibacter sp.]